MLIMAEPAAGASGVCAPSLRGPGELFVEADGPRALALVAAAASVDPGWTSIPLRTLFARGRDGASAGEWLFRVGLWVPAEARAEFLAWYEQEHLPILLECATWDGCRFVEADAARGCQFYALHRLSDRAALDSPERARSRSTEWFRRLARNDWFDGAFTRTLYRRSTPR